MVAPVSVCRRADMHGASGWRTQNRREPSEKSSTFSERTNGESMAYFVNASQKVLYPAQVKDAKVLLPYTDAAAYMFKVHHSVKTSHPQIVHGACLAHALHRACEEQRKNLSDVNELIAFAKSVFLKVASQVRSFQEELPDVILSPELIVTLK